MVCVPAQDIANSPDECGTYSLSLAISSTRPYQFACAPVRARHALHVVGPQVAFRLRSHRRLARTHQRVRQRSPTARDQRHPPINDTHRSRDQAGAGAWLRPPGVFRGAVGLLLCRGLAVHAGDFFSVLVARATGGGTMRTRKMCVVGGGTMRTCKDVRARGGTMRTREDNRGGA